MADKRVAIATLCHELGVAPLSLFGSATRRAERLIREGRMREPGLVAVRCAKGSGQWQKAYESQRAAVPREDLPRAV